MKKQEQLTEPLFLYVIGYCIEYKDNAEPSYLTTHIVAKSMVEARDLWEVLHKEIAIGSNIKSQEWCRTDGVHIVYRDKQAYQVMLIPLI